ncbi:MAG: RNA polymerase sigma factor [Bacteroidota bacterium]
MLTSEDKLLLQACLKGNQNAQTRLYRQYVQAMFNLVVRMVPNRMEAEDVVQEVFVKVFQKLETFKGEATLGAWIKRIAINTALGHLRKKGKINIVELETQQEPIEEVENNDTHYDMKRIHHAIKQLPDGCRVIFNLYLLEGYRHQEIAQLLGVSESTSKTQYHRAKVLLRKLLK